MKLVDFEKIENKRTMSAREAYEAFHNGTPLALFADKWRVITGAHPVEGNRYVFMVIGLQHGLLFLTDMPIATAQFAQYVACPECYANEVVCYSEHAPTDGSAQQFYKCSVCGIHFVEIE